MRRAFSTVATVAAAAMVMGAAMPGAPAHAASVRPLRMTVGTLGTIGSLDPRTGTSAIAREVWNLQYPTLTGLDPETLEPTTGLASAWRPLADGHGWRYSLRANQAWSDGRPVTAADVVYSLNRARAERWPYAIGLLASLSAHAVNAHTVDVTSTGKVRPKPGLLLHIVPEHVYSKAANLDTSVTALGIADGAWHVVSKSDDSVELGVLGRPGGPPLDQIVFRTYPTADALIAALAHRDVDVISGVPDTDVDRIENLADVTVVHAGDGTQYVLRFMALPDPRLRRVISLAIDSTQLVADAVHGVGTPATSSARPAQAKRELRSFDPNAKLVPTIAIAADPTAQKVGALVRAELSTAGLKTHVVDVGSPGVKTGRTNLVIERVLADAKPADAIELFEPDTLQAFRSDNVSGFLREPSRRGLVAFGPTVAPYAAIVAATRPHGEQLSNTAYAIGAVGLLALFAFAYWVASRLRRRFTT